MADTEYVYLLTNTCMPDWVKVGKAKNIKNRMSDLDCTAVPIPFECYAYLEVPADMVFDVEHTLHDFLGRSITKEKEFFRTKPDVVLGYFQRIERLNNAFHLVVNPDLESSADKKKAQSTNFEMLGIPIGASLTYTRDDSVSCVVTDSKNQVSYQSLQWSLSGLACNLSGYNVNGYTVFMYEDETLWQRRLRLEKEGKLKN